MRPRTALAVALVSVFAFSGAEAADKNFDLRYAHHLPAKFPLHTKGMVPWTKSIEEASGGSIKITIFPSQQLGKAKDQYDMAKDGIVDIAWYNPGFIPGRWPIISAIELPLLVSDSRPASTALTEWYQKYAQYEMNDVHFCLAHALEPGVISSKPKKIVMPQDLKGLKIRPMNGTIAQLVKNLGGSSVYAPGGDTRDLVERGIADAVFFSWNSMQIWGIHKPLKYHMDFPIASTAFIWVMNKGTYGKFSAAQKKVIDAHCTPEWARKVTEAFTEWEFLGRTKLQNMKGHEVYKISREAQAAWHAAAKPIRAHWARGAAEKGVDADKAYGELVAALKKHNALLQ